MNIGNEDGAFGDLLIGALEEAVAYEAGELPGTRAKRVSITARRTRILPPPAYTPEEIRYIRHALSMSQQVFADLLNASASAVRAWEQGTRVPDGPTRRLLQVAHLSPEVLTYNAQGDRPYTHIPQNLKVAEHPLAPWTPPGDGDKRK
jgi:DNA-binding transcriptional regulator YiaG